MSEIGQNLKNIVMKSIEALGNTANNIASTTKQKVDEYNLSNDQKDIFCEIGRKVFEMSLNGISLPDSLQEDLQKAMQIDKELKEIRNVKNSDPCVSETSKDSSDHFTDSDDFCPAEVPSAIEFAAENNHDVPVIEVEDEAEPEKEPCPLSSAINDLFEKMPPVDKMMDKVNTSLDELGENLRKFSGDFDKQLNDFADQMMKDDKNDPKE